METMTQPSAGPKRLAKRTKKKNTVLGVVGKVCLTLVLLLVITFVGAYTTLWMICHGPSTAASDLFVSTILETGQAKFLASWYFSEEEILEITSRNGMGDPMDEVNTGLITIPNDPNGEQQGGEPFDLDAVTIEEISGRTFYAKMLIINDPSRVKMATIYPWSDFNRNKSGQTLEELVTGGNYLAGINGGIYYSDGNWGGRPMGVVVSHGELQYNDPKAGDVLVGFNEDNILIIKDLSGMTAAQVEQLVADERVRDAICFKDIDDGDDNHFTTLIVNGKAREITGTGSGANPRTVIGQRADGAVLMLVTDGRGAAGHLGATAQDLISIMLDYGAVNAANLDGGSSSAMYYDGGYEMTSVTLYYSTSSWKLPTAFVVERRDGE